jgi:uncharacterized protein (DUF302 family)
MSTPRRYWLTGGVAAVLAAASQTPPRAEEVRGSRSSRFSVKETIERIEQQARHDGMPVFARFTALPGTSCLLVLGSDDEHTLVLQHSPDAELALPLTVSVGPGHGGGAEVQFTDPGWVADHDGLPADLLARVAALPAMIDAALAAGQRHSA